MKNIFPPLATVIRQVLPPLAHAINVIIPPLAKALGNVITALAPVLRTMVTAMTPWLKAVTLTIAHAVSVLAKPIGQLITVLAPAIGKMLLGLAKPLANIVTLLLPPLTKLVGASSKIILQLANACVKLMPPLTKALVALTPYIIDLAKVITKLADLFSKGLGRTLGAVQHPGAALKKVASTAAHDFGSEAPWGSHPFGLKHSVGHYWHDIFHAKGGPIGLATGGPVGFANGGFPGGPMGTDTTPAWLTPGEGVLDRLAMRTLGLGGLNRLNEGQLPAAHSHSVGMQPGNAVSQTGHSAFAGAQITLEHKTYIGQRVVAEETVHSVREAQ